MTYFQLDQFISRKVKFFLWLEKNQEIKTNYNFQIYIICCGIYYMLLFNIFTYKQHFLPILLQCIILILKSSPELLLNKFQKSQKDATEITFIFSILQGTNNFRLIIVGLITLSFILCLYSIFSQKKGILGFQLISNLLFPIQLYLTVWSINQGSTNKVEQVFFGLTFIISLIIILSKFLVFDFRTDSAVIVKAYGKWYVILSESIMLFNALMSFFIDENSKATILIVLLVLTLAKSYFLFYYITFESPLIEYATYVSEPMSWISLLTILLSTIYGISTPLLLWGYLCFILMSIFFQNSILRYLMEKKYIHFFRKQITFKANRNKQKIHDIQDNLIIYLSLVILGLKLKDKTVSQESFLRFSEHFVHQICTSIIRLEEVILKKKPQGENNHHSSSGQSSSEKNGVNLSLLMRNQFNFQNQHQYAQKYWAIIKQMKQLQDQRFNNLRKYICYSLPQITNAFQARIIYIYYLNRQNESRQTKDGKIWSRLNFIDDLHNEIDFNFVVQKSKNKLIQEMLIKSAINSHGSVMVSERSDNEYCLKTQLVYGSGFFEQFYRQTIFEQALQKQLQQYYHLEKQLVGVVGSIHSSVDELTQRLVKVHKVKSNITRIIEQCPQVQTRQFILQQYVLSKYVLKLPFLARDKLRQVEQQHDDRHMKQKIVLKSHSKQSNSVQRKKMEDNEAVMMISAVRRKGNIVYGSSNFKQIMEIKSISNLNTEDSHQYLHINHFLLPCWIEAHDKVMQSLMIYEKPFHHVGNKFHMKSIISKKVFEVEFTMHFITCSMDDLIIAVDLKYKKLDYLSITKNGQKIFLQSGNQNNNHSRRNSISSGQQSQNQQRQQSGSITNRLDYSHKKRVKSYQQQIFGQKYQILSKYSYEDDQQSMLQISTAVSHQQDQSSFKLRSSMSNFQYDRMQKRIQTQKKLYHYRKNHFLFTKDYFIIIVIKVMMMLFLMILAIVLANLLIQQSDLHKQFYQFRHKIQNEYYLTDLKSFNSFLMLFVPITPYIKFPSNDSIIEFEKVWYKVFKEEIYNLKTRGMNLAIRPYDANYALRLNFKSLDQTVRTFLFEQQKFQIQYFNIINQLNLQSINNGNFSQFPNPDKDLNLAQSRLLDDLYEKSLVRYTQYLQPNGVFDSLQLLGVQLIDDEYSKLQLIYFLIIAIVVIGTVSFAILYIKYLNNLFYFTSSLFQLPQQTITRLQTQLQDFKDFITVLFLSYSQQSKDASQSDLYKNIQTYHQISIKNKTLFIRKSQKNKTIKQIKKFSSLKSNWKQVILLRLFLLTFFLLLYGSYVQANTEIDLMVNYMAGTLQLAQISAKSINIFTWLIDGIFYVDKPINPQIPFLIDQIKRVDLLRTMQKLQPNTVDIELSLFTSWYENNYMKLNFFDDLQAKRTLMETFTKSIQLYQMVYSKLSIGERITIIDSKLIVQMYKEISHSTQMIRQLLNKSQNNYFNAVPTFNIYLILNILINLFFCFFILYFTHRRLFRHTKMVFEETLSLTKIHDLLLVPTLAYHLHQSEKQNLYRDTLQG